MNKFLIVGLTVISNLLFSADAFLPKSNNPYYYIQRLYPSPLNIYNDNTYYFSQMNEDDKKKGIHLDISKEEKELELKKELLKDNIDWNKIGILNKEIENIKADINLMFLKAKYNHIGV